MDKKIIEIMKSALRGVVEDLIQSENGPTEEDLAYIENEWNYIKSLEAI